MSTGVDEMKFSVIFMGTPYFASEVLDHLIKREDLDVKAVVTQPDRVVGRKRKIVYSEVKELALSHQLSLFQPEKIKDIKEELEALQADAIITCAYGQFLPTSILDLTPHGVINVHASLLPKYRGGAPMQHAIYNGEKTTGITLMKSALKMDAGDIYSKIEVKIDPNDTLKIVEQNLIEAAIEILKRDLIDILNHKILPIPQDHDLATFAPVITRENELIDFNREASDVVNHIRSLIDNPYAYGYLNGKRVKICKIDFEIKDHNETTGEVIEFSPESLVVALKGGLLKIYELQVEGKALMTTQQLYPGYHKQWLGQRFTGYEAQ